MMRQQPSTSVGVDSHLLESVFTSAISGLSGEIQMLERVKGGFLINSFCITDTRNASAKYIYRDLLKRSGTNILYIDPAGGVDEDNDDVNLCTILFEQKSTEVMHMEIKIQVTYSLTYSLTHPLTHPLTHSGSHVLYQRQ
jgi:hypothetical protein